jgi:hypothetical protein
MSVDKILQSDAFGHVSPFSPQTKKKIDRYDQLVQKRNRRSTTEEKEFQWLLDFMGSARPIGGAPAPGSIDAKVEEYLERHRHPQDNTGRHYHSRSGLKPS